MKKYFRLMLGRGSKFAEQCFNESFIGVGYKLAEDVTGRFPDTWRAFNHEFIPVYLKAHPGKSRVAAGLACGAIWTVGHALEQGDIIFSPDGTGAYRLAEITGGYEYDPGKPLPHSRSVRWLDVSVESSAMSPELLASSHSPGTLVDIAKYRDEIESFLDASSVPTIKVSDPTIEDPVSFALEKHLEEFLVLNWAATELGRNYDIYEVDGEKVGQQYATDTGPIDILAIHKETKELLVVELKKGRASDAVVGQVLRYMGYVMQELAEPDQSVRGVIIAEQCSDRLQWALAAAPNIDFYSYQVSFALMKA